MIHRYYTFVCAATIFALFFAACGAPDPADPPGPEARPSSNVGGGHHSECETSTVCHSHDGMGNFITCACMPDGSCCCGCVNQRGQCVEGSFINSQCGIYGSTCRDCTASIVDVCEYNSCRGGVCTVQSQNDGTVCSAFGVCEGGNCSCTTGCANAAMGTCLAGTDPASCGAPGDLCVDCNALTGPNSTCVNGTCVAPPPCINGNPAPDDGNPCTQDYCAGPGNPQHVALPPGANCGVGMGCSPTAACLPTCQDGVADANESDIDCGGFSACLKCGTGKNCPDGNSCISGACDATHHCL